MRPHDQDESDIVLDALSSLADDTQLELPDPRLERRLLRAAARRSNPGLDVLRRPWPVSRAARWVASVTLGLLLMGATVQVTGLWSWWYTIRIGDQELEGAVDGAGVVHADYTTPDGYRVTVRLARTQSPEGYRTSFEAREEGHGAVNKEIEETIEMGPGSSARQADDGCYEVSVLASTRVLHAWRDRDGRQQTLHLGDDPDGPGSRLLAHDVGSASVRPVDLVLCTPFRVGEGSLVSITEGEAGRLEIRLVDGQGNQIVAVCGGRRAEAKAPQEFRTPSGRVRARVGGPPQKKRR